MLKNKINKSDKAVRHQVRDMRQKCLNNNTSHLIISQSCTALVAFYDFWICGREKCDSQYHNLSRSDTSKLPSTSMWGHEKVHFELEQKDFPLHQLNLVEIESEM